MSDILGKPATPQTKPNYAYTIISVAMVLFLLGFFGLLFLQAQQLTDVLKERVNILVEIKPNTEQVLIASLVQTLQNKAATKPGSVLLITKEEALASLQKDFGEDFLNLDFPNPLYDVVSFNLNAGYMDTEQLHAVRHELKSNNFVKDVYYQEGLVHQIVSNIKKMSWIFLVLGLVFLVIAITLIHNTIRLALYANRFLIKNMELVGATWSFISRPYIQRSVFHGIISAIFAFLSLICLLLFTKRYIPEFVHHLSPSSLFGLFVGLLLMGVLINGWSTYFVVNKYLKMRVEELY